MRTVNNHKQLLIGKKLARTAGLAATVVTSSSIAAGEIVVTDVDGTILDSTTVLTYGDTNRRRLVMGQGSTLPLIISADIYKPGVRTYTGKAYAAAVQQIDYIGFDGALATGSIDLVVGNTYIIRSRYKSNFYQFSDKLIESFASWTVTTSDTQGTVAYQLTKNFIANTERLLDVPFKVERVNSDAGAATTGATGTLTFTKGSKTVTASVSATAEFSAGDYVRFGTAVTAVVYKVATASGTTITLDLPYQGTSGTLTAGNAEYITAALAAAGNFGIKLTGLVQTRFAPGTWRYETSKWVTTIQEAGATQISSPSTKPSEGSGTYYQIAEDEWFYQWQEGFADSMYQQVPNITFRSNVELTGTYTQVQLEWSSVAGQDPITNPTAFKQLNLAFNNLGGNGTQYTGVVTAVQTVLNAWLPAFPALNL